MVITDGCQIDNIPPVTSLQLSPYLPVNKYYQNGGPDCGFRGTLAIEDNIVRVRSTAFPGEPFYGSPTISTLAVWPYGYSLDTKGEKILLLNEKGKPVAIIGDYIYTGGGTPTDNLNNDKSINSLLSQPLPEGTKGPYFIITPPLPPNLPLELFQDLFRHRNIEPDFPIVTLEGTLQLAQGLDKGYLYLALENGKSVIPVWPPDSYCRIENYHLQVADGDGNSLASVGDKIKINGVEIPPELWGKYTGLPSPRLRGTYWYVSEVVKVDISPGFTSTTNNKHNFFTPTAKMIVTRMVVANGKEIHFEGTNEIFNATLQTQLYIDGKPLEWWPVNQDIKANGYIWEITIPLTNNGVPYILPEHSSYILQIWKKGNPSMYGIWPFDLESPPLVR